jgi:hypothetical protein
MSAATRRPRGSRTNAGERPTQCPQTHLQPLPEFVRPERLRRKARYQKKGR